MHVQRTILGLSLLALCGAARADAEPGLWEISATLSVANLPGVVGPLVDTRCLEAAEANDPGRLFGPSTGAQGCKFVNGSDSGSAYSFEVSCEGALALHGRGSVRYGRDFMQGSLDLAGGAGAQPVTTHTEISARRLGPCR